MKPSFLQRIAKRMGFEPIRKRNLFIGALQSRLTSDWNPYQASPTMELSQGLGMLRQRARDLERNNPIARRYLNLVAENVVGHKGIQLQVNHDSRQVSDALEAGFCVWHRPEHCTVEARLSWIAFQQLVVKTVARDGEAFVRLVKGVNEYGFALQLIDADLVDESLTTPDGGNGNAIRLGVEVNRWGRAVAYHVFTDHPFDMTTRDRTRQRIPADEILHLFIPRRPGQVRGESWLAPVLVALRMLDGYTEAELVAARTAAAKMGFIQVSEEGATAPDPDAPQQVEMEAAPGTIDRLAPGETFAGWDPTHPSGNYAGFVTQVGKFVAGGLNVAYASLSGDLREVNYSSIRAGLLQERDAWRSLQVWLADHLHEPVYRAWREVAWLRGHITLRMTPDQYTEHVWRPRGWAWVDPQKDIAAAGLAVALGFTSRQKVVADDGGDFEEVLADLQHEQELAEDYDVELMLPTGVSNGSSDAGTAADGSAAADADGGSGGDGDAGRGGRAHPRLAVVRRAS